MSTTVTDAQKEQIVETFKSYAANVPEGTQTTKTYTNEDGTNTKIVTDSYVEVSGNAIINVSGVFINDGSVTGSKIYNDLSCGYITTDALNVSGDSSLNGIVDVTGSLFLNGQQVNAVPKPTSDASFNTLIVVGDSSLNSVKTHKLNVAGDSSFNGVLDIVGSIVVNGISVGGDHIPMPTDVSFSLIQTADLHVTSDASFNGHTQLGDSSLNGVLNINGGLFLNGSQIKSSWDTTDISFNSVNTYKLGVNGDASFNGNLYSNGLSSLNGTVNLTGSSLNINSSLVSINSLTTTCKFDLDVCGNSYTNSLYANKLAVAGDVNITGNYLVNGQPISAGSGTGTVSGDITVNSVTTDWYKGNDLHINGANGVRLTATNQCVNINNDRGDPGASINPDVHFNWNSYGSNVYVDNGNLVVGYGDGVTKTNASRLDVNGDVNITGSVTTNTVQGASSGDMSITSNSALKMQSLNSNIDITAAGAVGIWPTGDVNIGSTTKNVNINPTIGEVWIYPNNTVHIEPTGGIVLNARGTGSNVDISAATGNVNVNPTGDATINPYGTVRITSQKGKDILINDDRTNWYSSADTGSGLGDVHFNLGSTKSNIYVDNGSLVVGYGDGFKKTSGNSLDVSGNANFTGSVTTNTITNSGDSSNPTISITSKNSTVGGACYTHIGFDSNNTGTLYLNPDNLKGSCVFVNSGCKDSNGLVSEWTNLCVDNGNFVVNSGSAIIGYGDYGGHHTSPFSLDVNGNISCTGSVQQSDYRLKSDVVDLSEQPEMTTMNLRPTSYTMDNKPCLGFIAHEVQEYFPQLVTGTKDGENYQTLNYVGLIAVLVNDIQKQQKQIESMKQDIDALQKQLTNKNE